MGNIRRNRKAITRCKTRSGIEYDVKPNPNPNISKEQPMTDE